MEVKNQLLLVCTGILIQQSDAAVVKQLNP